MGRVAVEEVDLENSASTPQATADTEGRVTLINQPVPSGCIFRARTFANVAGNNDGYSKLTWSMLVDGMPAKNFQRVADARGTLDRPQNIAQKIEARQSFQVIAENSDTTAAHVSAARVQGVFEKETSEKNPQTGGF